MVLRERHFSPPCASGADRGLRAEQSGNRLDFANSVVPSSFKDGLSLPLRTGPDRVGAIAAAGVKTSHDNFRPRASRRTPGCVAGRGGNGSVGLCVQVVATAVDMFEFCGARWHGVVGAQKMRKRRTSCH